MKITFKDKNYRVSEDEWNRYITSSMKALEYDTVEDWNEQEITDYAKQIWLEDNEIEINEEQAELVRKTAGITPKVDKNPEKTRKKSTRTPKINQNKLEIIEKVAEIIKNDPKTSEIAVTNNQKLIEFTYNGKKFKLNLTETREKKA